MKCGRDRGEEEDIKEGGREGGVMEEKEEEDRKEVERKK